MKLNSDLVGGPGFEPGASRSRTLRRSCPPVSGWFLLYSISPALVSSCVLTFLLVPRMRDISVTQFAQRRFHAECTPLAAVELAHGTSTGPSQTLRKPELPVSSPSSWGHVRSWQDLRRLLAPTQDVTVLRGAGRECGRRVEAGRLRPAPRQARHPTRWRLAWSAGESHQSPGRGPGSL